MQYLPDVSIPVLVSKPIGNVVAKRETVDTQSDRHGHSLSVCMHVRLLPGEAKIVEHTALASEHRHQKRRSQMYRLLSNTALTSVLT